MVAQFFIVNVANNYALNFNIPMPLHLIFRSVSISTHAWFYLRTYPVTCVTLCGETCMLQYEGFLVLTHCSNMLIVEVKLRLLVYNCRF